jgi:hypothetical protein
VSNRRVPRARQWALHGVRNGGSRSARPADLAPRLVSQRIDQEASLAPGTRTRSVRHGPGVGLGVPLAIDEDVRHPHQPDAVAHGVVQLQNESRPAFAQALDHAELPEGARAVELVHGDRLHQVEQRSQRAVARQAQSADVEGEIEVGIDLPAGRGEGERAGQHAVPQSGNESRRALDLVLEATRVGRPIQEPDHHDGRAQERVVLDGPEKRVAVVHAVLEADLVRHDASSRSRARRPGHSGPASGGGSTEEPQEADPAERASVHLEGPR